MKDEHKQNIGELLKQRRQELNLSLREAENGTSIRSTYLQAIEENHTEKLISPIYAQGFLRQYASFLGLDGDALVRRHPEFSPRAKRDQEFSYGIGTLEVRGHPGAGVKWLPNAVWILSFGLVIFIAWVLARYLEVI
jgi:cytoskeletal protein RodZ